MSNNLFFFLTIEGYRHLPVSVIMSNGDAFFSPGQSLHSVSDPEGSEVCNALQPRQSVHYLKVNCHSLFRWKFSDSKRPILDKKLFPVHRPKGPTGTFFPLFLKKFVFSSYFLYILVNRGKKEIIHPTDWLFFWGGGGTR